MKNSAEVVIVGGGISGCATAYYLAKLGCTDVVVLEKEYIASGATGRCGAGVRAQWGLELNCQLTKMSCEMFEELDEELDYDGDTEFKQGGYLMLATKEKEVEQFKKNVELQNKLGIKSELLTPTEALRIVPFLNTDSVLACSFHQKDGHLNPFYVTDAYMKAAKRLGVEFYTHTAVKDIKVDKGKIEGVVTEKGEIVTNKVLNAAGGWAKEIGKLAGIELPLTPERREILVTEPVGALLAPMIISTSLNFYCQQVPHGSFIMGRGNPYEKEGLNQASSWEFLTNMSKTITQVLPVLSRIRVVRQFAGMYILSPDAAPIYGNVPTVEGLYLAVGFSGHGFMVGPMTGLLMAQHILGKETEISIDSLDLGRFDRGELIREPSVV